MRRRGGKGGGLGGGEGHHHQDAKHVRIPRPRLPRPEAHRQFRVGSAALPVRRRRPGDAPGPHVLQVAVRQRHQAQVRVRAAALGQDELLGLEILNNLR